MRENERENSLRFKVELIALFAMVVVGFWLNHAWEHRNFYINQFVPLIMLFAQVEVLTGLSHMSGVFEEELRKEKKTQLYENFVSKVENGIPLVCNLVISVLFIVTYIFAMFKLGCLEHTPTGVYCGILGAVVFGFVIQLYLKFIGLLRFVSGLRSTAADSYNFYDPSRTTWIVQLAYMFRFIEVRFIGLGFLYCLIYAINLPSGAVVFDNGISFQTSCNELFNLTQTGIMVFYILAMPVFACFYHSCIEEYICRCKRKSVRIIKEQTDDLSQNLSSEILTDIQSKLLLLESVSKSAAYPHHRYIEIFTADDDELIVDQQK